MDPPFIQPDASTCAQVFVTADLFGRAPRHTDHLQEKSALQELAALMIDGPQQIMPRFVELAMNMTGGVSAGMELLEPEPAPGIFRRQHVRGALARFDGATTPRGSSPCAVALDEAGPVLIRRSERLYRWIAGADIVMSEALLVPLLLGNREPYGTLWIVSDEEEHFDSGHARAATELAAFVGIALRLQRSERELRAALSAKDELIANLRMIERQQDIFARELQHRMANTMAMVGAIASQSFRTSRTMEEAQDRLHARLRALDNANAILVRSSRTAAMESIVEGALAPHRSGEGRISIEGPELKLPARQALSLVLALHELATNATKYGALSTPTGRVEIAWHVVAGEDGPRLAFRWRETGGPEVFPPSRRGFGSRLIESALRADFSGAVTLDFARDGLVCSFSAPLPTLQGVIHQPTAT